MAGALLGLLSAPAASAQPSAIVLAGRNHFDVTGSETAVVSLPRDVTFGGHCLTPDDFAVTGSAEVVVVTLTPHPYQIGQSTTVMGRLPESAWAELFDSMCGDREMPAGSYTLHIAATEGTAQVRLDLPGVAGESDIETVASDAEVHVLPRVASPTDPASTSAAVWGKEAVLSGQGFAAVVGWAKNSPDADTSLANLTSCYSQADDHLTAAPPFIRYGRACSDAAVTMHNTVNGAAGTGLFHISTATNIPAGDYGLGFNYTATPGLSGGGAIALTGAFAQ